MNLPTPVPRAGTPCPARRAPLAALALLAGMGAVPAAHAQPVATPWGNVAGLLVDGQRMAFETSLRVPSPDWSGFVQSSKYNWEGRQTFTHEGKTQTSSHFLQGTRLLYTTRVTDTGRGSAEVDLEVRLEEDLPLAGAWFCVELPAAEYCGARFELLDADRQPVSILADQSGAGRDVFRATARGFRVTTRDRSLEVVAAEATGILLRQDFVDQPAYLNDPRPRLKFAGGDPVLKTADYQVYFSVLPGGASNGAAARCSYTIRVDGTVDTSPVLMTLDAGQPGRAFAGVGGNFRMQFPELDPQVVAYCLDNLDLAWGRIAFPWDQWQPAESGNEAAATRAGRMSPFFNAQAEMAQTLARRGIPVIVSVWNPPAWAVDQTAKLPKGLKLDPAKLQQIADSIADWLVFLKAHYGVEAALFSFNEPDYGVEVHQNAAEHALANRVIGATFAARGLATRMMAGDTGACTTGSNHLVQATLADPAAKPYLGAVAFHTYHGVTGPALRAWAESAQRANLPLLMTEGGPDSAAHRYPLIFTTPWFAQQEIDQYLRIAAICQPASILPWQLNADYSVLAGGGIYGDHGPLRPTQRFWNLKQLGSLKSGSFWLPLATTAPDVSCAALGDVAAGHYAVHITNNGPSRIATVSGLPPAAGKLAVYVTDATRGMQLMSVKGVVDGSVTFLLEAQTFTSLISTR